MKTNQFIFNKNESDHSAMFDSRQLASALYNWRLTREEPDPVPVRNAIVAAFDCDLQIVLPFIVMDDDFETVAKEDLEGIDIFEAYDSDHIVIPVLDDGSTTHWVPVFTSEEEMKKGEDTFFMYVSLTSAWEMICTEKGNEGIVFNPWSDNVPIRKEQMKKIYEHDPVSHLSLMMADEHMVRTDYKAEPMTQQLASGDFAAYYTRQLDKAQEAGCHSIAFSGLFGRDLGRPFEELVPVSLLTISDWLYAREDYVMDVYLCCGMDQEYQTYFEFMKALSPVAEDIAALENGDYLHQKGNYQAAYKYYLEAAKHHNYVACFRLGDMYHFGQVDGKVDDQQALSYYRKALKGGAQEKDPEIYPDLCLKVVRYFAGQLTQQEIHNLLTQAIDGFMQRIADGDSGSDELLEEARQLMDWYCDE